MDIFGFVPISENEYNLGTGLLGVGADIVTDTADIAIGAGITAVDTAAGTVDMLNPKEQSGIETRSAAARTTNMEVSPKTTSNEDGDAEGQNSQIKFVDTAHYIDYALGEYWECER